MENQLIGLVLSSQANKDKYMLKISRWRRGEKEKEKIKYSLLLLSLVFF